jgi:hypothetical protein
MLYCEDVAASGQQILSCCFVHTTMEGPPCGGNVPLLTCEGDDRHLDNKVVQVQDTPDTFYSLVHLTASSHEKSALPRCRLKIPSRLTLKDAWGLLPALSLIGSQRYHQQGLIQMDSCINGRKISLLPEAKVIGISATLR